jgi:DNA end-binding protein Ku
MARAIWKGHIAFGLVSVPVALHSREQKADLSFHLVDSKNSARVRYERVNEETGEEVPWDRIVKGYEYSDNNYVLLSEDELEYAAAEMTRTIEIEKFVDLTEIDIGYFERPYVLLPIENGEKAYVLLREAIRESGRVGISRVVIRARQHLAAILVKGNALELQLLRFHQELVDPDSFNLPSQDFRQHKVTKQEVELAAELIEGMTAKWNAAEFEDEYRSALIKLVKKKIASGHTEPVEIDELEEEATLQTINFIDVLKASVAQASKKRTRRHRSGSKKARGQKLSSGKKQAG